MTQDFRDTDCSLAAHTAQSLNAHCQCRTLDPESLRRHLDAEPQLHDLVDTLRESRPSLFSATAVFLSHEAFSQIRDGIRVIERVIALPAYQAEALARAPITAHRDFGPIGVFTSFDFHLGPTGPRLIEINSNAGGALLASALGAAQRACCEPMSDAAVDAPAPLAAEGSFLAMFRREWQLQRGAAALGRVLIVDDEPASQYLAPEFELFRRLFKRHGIDAAVADAAALQWRDGALWFEHQPVDMVYNRLTDFYLQEPRHSALREAWLAGAVVLTPHPRTHALYADKRNLGALSDDALLASWEVSQGDRSRLHEMVPRTQLVTAANAEKLWAQRKGLFFKPAGGYGAKAAWRGDKITRKVWEQVIGGGFLAQELVPPSQRLVAVDGTPSQLRFDLRAYTYAGEIQLLTARIYAGQTTNFRTPGGGFAAVVVLADALAPVDA